MADAGIARDSQIADFLSQTDWHGAEPAHLAGDASNRRYFRVRNSKGSAAVLMDAPPDKGEDTRPFVAVAQHLLATGLRAPDIYAADDLTGFLLLEDLGDNLYARHLAARPEDEPALYEAAVDVLVQLQHTPPADLAPYDAATMAPLAALAASWYAGDRSLSLPLQEACARALRAAPQKTPTIVLRDYHAENLLWLPMRKGAARVGLLDFQDARSGQPAYDVASILHDARRDVGSRTQSMARRQFADATGTSILDLDHALAPQGAQRNLRILGVFARLSLHYGKAGYVALLPRVWKNLMAELAHPALTELRGIVEDSLPSPDDAHLQDLRDRCGTIPMLA